MAGPGISDGAQKRKRTKKKKSRTEVSSSDSESEVEQRKSKKNDVATADPQVIAKDGETLKKTKEKKQSKSPIKPAPTSSEVNGEDVSMVDASPGSSVSAPAPSKPKESRQEQDFTSIYLKKVTAELADDLDKVREAQDFTTRSLPMLIHALKQGESIFSAEEKRRVVAAVNA